MMRILNAFPCANDLVALRWPVRRVPPAPSKYCHMPVAHLQSVDPTTLRNLLHPIALNLSELFGLQISHVEGEGEAKQAAAMRCELFLALIPT